MKENNIGSEAIRPENLVLTIRLDSMNPIFDSLIQLIAENSGLKIYCPFCRKAYRWDSVDVFQPPDGTGMLSRCKCGKFASLSMVPDSCVMPIGSRYGEVTDMSQVKQFTFPAEITLKIVPELTPEEMGII